MGTLEKREGKNDDHDKGNSSASTAESVKVPVMLSGRQQWEISLIGYFTDNISIKRKDVKSNR